MMRGGEAEAPNGGDEGGEAELNAFARTFTEPLRQLFQRAPGLVVLLRGPDHVFEYANPAFIQLVGERDLVDRPVAEAMPELADQGFVSILDSVYRTGQPFTGRAVPVRLRRGDDAATDERYFDFVYQPIPDGKGRIEGVFGQASDVTERVLAERALHDTQARLEDLFSQVTVGIAQCDLNGRFRLINDRQCEILGRSRDELLDLTMQEVTHADDLPENVRLLRRLLETGEPFVIEKRYLRGDGGVAWVRNNVSLVRDREGRPQFVTAVVVDISQEKQAELALRRSEALSEAVLQSALDSIILISEDSRVLEWNPAAERTFGVPRAEAVGAELDELIIPPEQRQAHRRGMERFLKTGEGPVVGRRVEVEAQTRDGRRMPVELAITPISLEGRVVFAAYLRDISTRREAEAALREGEQRLNATYEHAFAAIGEVDAEGRFVRVNEQFSAITGYSRDELLARTIWDLTHPGDGEMERPLFARHMAGELPVYSLEKRYIHRNGYVVWVELAASTVEGPDGRPLYGVRVVRDVTERRRWSERQQLLLNELNHRVKNTLATVQSIAVQSGRSSADPQASLAAFLERLMALARAHDVLTRQAWEGADMRTIVEGAVRPFGGEAKERFRINGPTVWLDPQRALALALALHELSTNAAKYGALTAPKGCVAVKWCVARSDGEDRLHLTWSESGGPPIGPPARKGFGTRLLERSLAIDLGGTVHMDFRPGGLVCTVDAPLEDRLKLPWAGP